MIVSKRARPYLPVSLNTMSLASKQIQKIMNTSAADPVCVMPDRWKPEIASLCLTACLSGIQHRLSVWLSQQRVENLLHVNATPSLCLKLTASEAKTSEIRMDKNNGTQDNTERLCNAPVMFTFRKSQRRNSCLHF